MQDNITFKTVTGIELVLKPYITGREAEILTQIVGETVEKRNVELSHKTIELVVVSVGGKTEDVLNTILDLPFTDYIEITTKVQEIATGKKNETDTKTTL
jgi:hypothetical protein